MFKRRTYLKYSFINNSILLSTDTINKNGFFEVWRQINKKTNSIQIICFNESSFEFKAFDRFHWSDEPFHEEAGCFSSEGWYYKKDLWTPIKLHFSIKWLKSHLN